MSEPDENSSAVKNTCMTRTKESLVASFPVHLAPQVGTGVGEGHHLPARVGDQSLVCRVQTWSSGEMNVLIPFTTGSPLQAIFLLKPEDPPVSAVLRPSRYSNGDTARRAPLRRT